MKNQKQQPHKDHIFFHGKRLIFPVNATKPNTNHQACKRYKSLVDVQGPPKRDDITSKIHPIFYHTSAPVNFVGELPEMFSDKTIALSADDNIKVHVGTLAVIPNPNPKAAQHSIKISRNIKASFFKLGIRTVLHKRSKMRTVVPLP